MSSHFKSWMQNEKEVIVMEKHGIDETVIAAYEQRKNDIHREYDECRKKCNEAYQVMQDTWAERVSARERLSKEFRRQQLLNRSGQRAWAEYGNIRDVNNALIADLKPKADEMHQKMHEKYDRANFERKYGHKDAAMAFSAEGRAYQKKRDELNDKISELAHEVTAAKRRAETRASRNILFSYKEAKAAFDVAKAQHEKARKKYKKIKGHRNQLRIDYELAKASYERVASQ